MVHSRALRAAHAVGADKRALTTITASQRIVHSPKNLLLHPVAPPSPPQPLIFALSPWFCLFQNATQLESYSRQPFHLVNMHLRVSGAFPWPVSSFLLMDG